MYEGKIGGIQDNQKGLQTGLSCGAGAGEICRSPGDGRLDDGECADSAPEEYPQSEDGEVGTLTVKGETRDVSMELSLWPRCDMRREPTEMSTPVDARHLLTSVAQAV